MMVPSVGWDRSALVPFGVILGRGGAGVTSSADINCCSFNEITNCEEEPAGPAQSIQLPVCENPSLLPPMKIAPTCLF